MLSLFNGLAENETGLLQVIETLLQVEPAERYVSLTSIEDTLIQEGNWQLEGHVSNPLPSTQSLP